MATLASSRRRWDLVWGGAAAAVLVALPFLAVTLPPITDLPQQTAQIRLLAEAWQGGSPYRIQWLHPNQLGYLPVGLAWLLAGPLAAGPLGLLALGLLWVAAAHAVAGAFERSPGAAILAGLFFFNHVTYWGFLSFLSGVPAFLLWLVLLHRQPRAATPWRRGVALLGTAALLYLAHVLWLAAALLWLPVAAWLGGWRGRTLLVRAVWSAPPALAAAVWLPTLTAGGFDSETFWGRSPLGRLHPGWLTNSALGGLKGWVEPALLVAVAAWLALGLWQHRGRWPKAAHTPLLVAAALFLLAALTLPGVTRHTIFFASRWLPVAALLAVLGAPAPRLGRWLGALLPLLLLAALSVATTVAWVGFERQELAGLEEALGRLPEGPRVLGIELVRTSPRIDGFPYYHLYAYAQVLHGGVLNRSFAEEASSLVVFRRLPHHDPWTPHLDWKPQQLRRSDIPYFDFVLVHAEAAGHAPFAADPRLTPVTAPAPWRLYRVGPGEDRVDGGEDEGASRR